MCRVLASEFDQETGSAMDKRYRETALGGLAADYERSLQETPQLHLGKDGKDGKDDREMQRCHQVAGEYKGDGVGMG